MTDYMRSARCWPDFQEQFGMSVLPGDTGGVGDQTANPVTS